MPDPDLTAPLAESLTLAQEAKRGRELRERLKLLRQDVTLRRTSSADGALQGSKYDSGYHTAMIWVNNELDALLEERDDA